MTFGNAGEASQVRKSMHNLEEQGLLSLDDSAVIVKDAEGKVHVKNEMDRGVKVGAVGGGALGLLIGSVFFPFAGLIGGVLVGAVVGKMADLGVDQRFVRDVSADLEPDSSALFILVREANPAAAISALKPYKGQVYHTSLPADTEQELRSILSKRI
jgi:uncharacterized membrane protein